ncbi:myosin V [Purpureocillium lavendulum]|uniref:2-oxoglutarate reductase n=1 Tax=Purpureocillium lavendulum TaxID=1247861 RepID=A0AB34FJ81_9HYPO|nr:myosin V [Purpureocillium lavendulum]
MTPARDILGAQPTAPRSVSHSWGNNLSTSPTATFHSPPGSWGGNLPQRGAPKQLKPFNTQDIKILLLENVNKTGQETLREQGYQVEALKTSLPEDQLIEKIRDVQVIGIRSKTKLTEKVLREAKNLLVIGCFCIGTNQVDLDYAARHGIAVFNSPFANSRSVAELVIAEIITLARQLGDRSNEMHRGTWNKVSAKCWEIRGKTLGIVGYGHIGSQLSVLSEAMGMNVIYYDVVTLMALGTSRQVPTLEALLEEADFVTLHVPDLPETRNMISTAQLEGMKNGSYLINASRGSVVDIPALIKAMRSGKIAGAALDVYPHEPAANGDYFNNNLNQWGEDLRSLSNIILTPHIGGSTEEAQRAIGIEVADALVRYINQGITLGSVNLPEAQLRSLTLDEPDHARVIYIHRNVPGVLRKVNEILGDHNVDKQISDSRGDVAYLMADISNVQYSQIKDISDSLEALSSTFVHELHSTEVIVTVAPSSHPQAVVARVRLSCPGASGTFPPMASTYDVGTRAWQPDAAEGWVASELITKNIDGPKATLVFQLENGQTKTIEVPAEALQSGNDPSLPPLMNPTMLEASDDLTNLSHLNEPAVLQAIRLRYAQKEIYTYSGIVLIATNPFARVDSLYVPGMVQVYAGKQRATQAPHLFAIAEEAFIDMIRDGKNQTIVVSGESGAGKTVSAKYIMRYFATRESPDQPGARSKRGPEAMSETEEQILATNPIMEAFGNAKTTRNDNSSRFGKYIEIMFDDKTNIIGAKIRTYLLERSRLVFQPLKERNYHIFYQLVAGASDKERQELDVHRVEQFEYLNQGDSPTIDGVDDKAEFEATKRSLQTIGVSDAQQADIFKLLAGLLHLGNVKITASRNDSVLAPTEPSLERACDILGVKGDEFAKWIVKKQLITRGDKITSNLSQAQAIVVRDSVAKFIYSSLFDWLVDIINQSLATEEVLSQVTSFIGVLDIYGFEHFAKNSFEQFCINYANEKLQQEFNQHVFKLEQEEYLKEQIDWTFIDFSDNQPCIDLIEGKMGVLSLLDEESRLPMGSDDQFVTKLYQNFAAEKQHNFFKKPRFGKSAFTVCHYAIDVTYESEGFIEKNRDTVPDEHMAVLRATTNPFLKDVLDAASAVREKDVASAASNAVKPAGGRKIGVAVNRKPTLGGIFRSSLIELMHTINNTDVHYIRCIKPNEAKEAWQFEGPMVLSQLRACGVLETVRISCAGYPTRWTYEEFALRYYMLVHSSQWTSEIRNMANAILTKALGTSTGRGLDKYQLGLTKIFFRAGMLAFLENLRTNRLNECAILIQKNLRAKFYRHRYLAARESVIRTQSAARAYIARRQAQELRTIKAATTIQRVWRGQKQRKNFLRIKQNLVLFESAAKGYLRRKQIMETRVGNAAVVIQRAWRSRRQLATWRQYRRKVALVQSLWRGKSARREYKTMREEARDLKQISYKLENKVVELTQSLGSMKEKNKNLASQVESYESQIKSWKSRHNALEARTKELQTEANQAGIAVAKLQAMEDEMKKLQQAFDESTANIKRMQEEERELRESLRLSNTELETAKQTSTEREKDNTSLRQELEALRDALEVAKRSAPVNGELTNGTAAPTAATGLINLVSSKKPKRRSAGAEPRDLDRFSGAYNPRPVSMAVTNTAHRQNLSGTTYIPGVDNIEMELETLLADEDGLNEEVTMGLIRNLKIPSPNTTPPPSDKEVLFPSYLINLVTSEMWNNGFVKESERFLANVMQSIQQEVMQHDGDEAINPGAFWLSNVHEMLSFVFLAEDWYETQKTDNYEYDRLLEIVKHDLESLEFNIYHTWMKVLKKKLQKMIIPAIIESQSLPGFITNESNRFLGKLLQSNSAPAYSMDNLLSLLNSVFRAMKAFYLEDSIIMQTVTELLRLVGVTAFNDLLMRRNFLSWKRGLQINYNITRIEEWCKSHDMPEGTLQLEHLMQATKLLQLKKATLNDIEIIQDICWMLSPNQIQKLLNQYLVADYEQPINGEIMKAVASRVTEKSDVLLLQAVDMDDSGPYEIAEPRSITALETYTPSWLQTPRLKRLAEIVSAQAIAQQEKLEYTDGDGFDGQNTLAEVDESAEEAVEAN